MHQMPREGKLFKSVDQIFRKIMLNALEKPVVLEATDGQLPELHRANRLLDDVERGLSQVCMHSPFGLPP